MPTFEAMHAAVKRIQHLHYMRERIKEALSYIETRTKNPKVHDYNGATKVEVTRAGYSSIDLDYEMLTGKGASDGMTEWDERLVDRLQLRLAEIDAEILTIERTT